VPKRTGQTEFMIATVCSMLFCTLFAFGDLCFLLFGLIKSRLHESTSRLRDLSKWYIQ